MNKKRSVEVLPLYDLERIYPYNIVKAIGITGEDLYLVNPIELIAVMATDLTQREARVMFDYYDVDNIKTLDEIAEILGVTRERVRQIKEGALRKMRSPKRMKKYMAVSRKQYDKDIAALKDNIVIAEEFKIDDLELSIRPYNALARYFGKKLGEYKLRTVPVDRMLGMTVEEIAAIKNVGRRSLEEILVQLKEKANIVPNENGVLVKGEHQNEHKG